MKRGRQEKYYNTSRYQKRQHHSKITDIEKSNSSIHIPFDVTVDILSRLPVKSLVRFQCVSKLWSSIITVSIMTRSLFSSSSTYYPLNSNTRTFIHAEKYNSTTLLLSCDFEYQYIRARICCWSSLNYNPSMSQPILLPETEYDKRSNSCDGFFGYDPVENQVFRLLGGPSKQQRRSLDIQGIATSSGLCMNEFIYYIAHTRGREYPEIMRFNVRFERFDHIQMPITLEMNKEEDELTLVNYQEKLGCIRYGNDSAEMWIMEKQEWSSKIILSMGSFLLKSLGYSNRIAGVTANGEIAIMPKTLKSDQALLDAYYYDLKQHKSVKVFFETGTKISNWSLYLYSVEQVFF